jgi:hypothetical protein
MKTAKQFLDLFRMNLLDVGVDPSPYGTHSFRRGGAQFLSDEVGLSVKQICEWGGWSYDSNSTMTIFKYLCSWVDSPVRDRESLLDPDRPVVRKCPTCHRSCNCR